MADLVLETELSHVGDEGTSTFFMLLPMLPIHRELCLPQLIDTNSNNGNRKPSSPPYLLAVYFWALDLA